MITRLHDLCDVGIVDICVLRNIIYRAKVLPLKVKQFRIKHICWNGKPFVFWYMGLTRQWHVTYSVTYAPIPLGYDLFPTLPTSADLGTCARAATVGNNRQNCAVSTFWLRCSHARYAVNTIKIRRSCRSRYVLHTLIHDPKPIVADPMTMYLQWRRSW